MSENACSQFHQCFTKDDWIYIHIFWTQFWRQKYYKAETKLQSQTFQLCNFWRQNIGRKMLMKSENLTAYRVSKDLRKDTEDGKLA